MGKQKNKPSKALRKRQEEVGLPAIIFSFDGTVMDTEPAIFASYRQMFSQFGNGRRFTEKEEERVVGQPSVKMLEEFFPDEDIDHVMKEYRMYQYYHLSDLIQPMPGIRDFLKWLKDNGYPIGIISSRNRASIVNMLEHAGLMQYIDVIIASTTKEHEFSDSESLRMCAKLLKKKVCIYIGHTPTHILNGHMVGVFTIAFNSNPKMLYQIIEAGPDFVTADYKQIIKLLKGQPLWLAYEIYEPEPEPKKEEAPAEPSKDETKEPAKEETKEPKEPTKEEKPAKPVKEKKAAPKKAEEPVKPVKKETAKPKKQAKPEKQVKEKKAAPKKPAAPEKPARAKRTAKTPKSPA
ncbi:MAG: HAD family hydrolase [Solobacterium sp.]|nr:HAD family hydrolase [Solobacterium sp.]